MRRLLTFLALLSGFLASGASLEAAQFEQVCEKASSDGCCTPVNNVVTHNGVTCAISAAADNADYAISAADIQSHTALTVWLRADRALE